MPYEEKRLSNWGITAPPVFCQRQRACDLFTTLISMYPKLAKHLPSQLGASARFHGAMTAPSTPGVSPHPLARRERFFFCILWRSTFLQVSRVFPSLPLSLASVATSISTGFGFGLYRLGLPLGTPTVTPSTLGLWLAGTTGSGGLDKCTLNVKRSGPELAWLGTLSGPAAREQ